MSPNFLTWLFAIALLLFIVNDMFQKKPPSIDIEAIEREFIEEVEKDEEEKRWFLIFRHYHEFPISSRT